MSRIASFRDAEIAIRNLQNSISSTGKSTTTVIDKTITNNVGGDGLDNIDGGAGTVIHTLIHKFRNLVYFGSWKWDAKSSSVNLDLWGPETVSFPIVRFRDTTPNVGRIEIQSGLFPSTTNLFSIGEPSHRWDSLFTRYWEIGTDLVPYANDTGNLGSSTRFIHMGWFNNLLLNSATATRPLATDSSKNLISALIDLASTNFVTGILPVANGGTGKSSVSNGSFLIGNGSGTLSETSGMTAGSLAVIFDVSWDTFTLEYLDHTSTPQTVTLVARNIAKVSKSIGVSNGLVTTYA